MYLHVCKPELCKNCGLSTCVCQQKHENIENGYVLICPNCGDIMSQATITSSSTAASFDTVADCTLGIKVKTDIDIKLTI